MITGFENGNPLGVLIRGQLGLDYHSLRDNSVLYDSDGAPVNKERDGLVEKLFNDILDRVSIFKQKPNVQKTIEGDRELIENGKDPTGEGGRIISVVEDGEVDMPQLEASANKATGLSSNIITGDQVRALGWQLKNDFSAQDSVTFMPQGTNPEFPTLGKTMDDVLRKYQKVLNLTDLDMRIMNWHYANLEYANASNVDSLSLGHWDQDDGQEPSGPHSTLLGGYMQVPRGLLLAPKPLDVKTRHVVRKITYNTDVYHPERLSRVECENGVVIDADAVVVTLPLGVLKAGAVEFNPPLPGWKSSAIKKLGYGLLNKVVLVYDKPFWDIDSDMVGLLRDPKGDPQKQESYEANRGMFFNCKLLEIVLIKIGRFYMFWNCFKSSGKPLLGMQGPILILMLLF